MDFIIYVVIGVGLISYLCYFLGNLILPDSKVDNLKLSDDVHESSCLDMSVMGKFDLNNIFRDNDD